MVEVQHKITTKIVRREHHVRFSMGDSAHKLANALLTLPETAKIIDEDADLDGHTVLICRADDSEPAKTEEPKQP